MQFSNSFYSLLLASTKNVGKTTSMYFSTVSFTGFPTLSIKASDATYVYLALCKLCSRKAVFKFSIRVYIPTTTLKMYINF